MSTFKYIIIPDVHGRDFWRPVIEKYINTDAIFIFLGDYLDPYGYEEIEDEYTGLLDIIDYKKKYNELVEILKRYAELEISSGGVGYGATRIYAFNPIPNIKPSFNELGQRNILGQRNEDFYKLEEILKAKE
jgi:hypothetical protein